MPRLKNHLPKYRQHKASGQAIVTLNGADHYLGEFGSTTSRKEYDRVVADWLTTGRQVMHTKKNGNANSPADELTINQLFLVYWKHVENYYRKDGEPTGEVQATMYALRPVINLYGDERVSDFGPLRLKAVRDAMIKDDFARKLINQRVHKIRRMFRWGVENELVDASILHGLQALSPLRAGRSEARESEPVRPLPEDILRKTQVKLPDEIKAMTELQWLTGMRPGEVVRMRTRDIDRTAAVWIYTPESHKTQHHGIKRTIPLGPKAQALIAKFLNDRRPDAYLFSPERRIRLWRKLKRELRKTNVQPSQAARRPKEHPRRKPGKRYTTNSYRQAIAFGCRKAKVECWGPNRLRHSAATRIRRVHGLDAARVILGHQSPAITEVYAEIDWTKAIDIAGKEM